MRNWDGSTARGGERPLSLPPDTQQARHPSLRPHSALHSYPAKARVVFLKYPLVLPSLLVRDGWPRPIFFFSVILMNLPHQQPSPPSPPQFTQQHDPFAAVIVVWVKMPSLSPPPLLFFSSSSSSFYLISSSPSFPFSLFTPFPPPPLPPPLPPPSS